MTDLEKAIEAAARGMFAHNNFSDGFITDEFVTKRWSALKDNARTGYRNKARAAVTAALPFLTHTEICMNEKCPRGGLAIEVCSLSRAEGRS